MQVLRMQGSDIITQAGQWGDLAAHLGLPPPGPGCPDPGAALRQVHQDYLLRFELNSASPSQWHALLDMGRQVGAGRRGCVLVNGQGGWVEWLGTKMWGRCRWSAGGSAVWSGARERQ